MLGRLSGEDRDAGADAQLGSISTISNMTDHQGNILPKGFSAGHHILIS